MVGEKRKLDGFFTPVQTKKQVREDITEGDTNSEKSRHKTYPFPISCLPTDLINQLAEVPASEGRVINDQPDLDLLFFKPFIPKKLEHRLFSFLRSQLFFYRVQYKIQRFGSNIEIKTPRYTTVFGVDSSARFTVDGELVDSISGKPVPTDRWNCQPRPLPQCLEHLRRLTEAFTDATYNFCLVNYYADGADSISYHSDDERFLGPNPAIASFSLGSTRDFLMKHKPPANVKEGTGAAKDATKTGSLKLPLGSGDMILMRGSTQSQWLHSIPKRKGASGEGGRINITFRHGVKKYATENYNQYNVGKGPVFKWDEKAGEMKQWEK